MYFVTILGIPERIFWEADYAFLVGVSANIDAYQAWKNYALEKEMEK